MKMGKALAAWCKRMDIELIGYRAASVEEMLDGAEPMTKIPSCADTCCRDCIESVQKISVGKRIVCRLGNVICDRYYDKNCHGIEGKAICGSFLRNSKTDKE